MNRKRSPDAAQRNPGYHLVMVRYRRNRVPGGTFFFTVALWDRRAHTLVDHIDLLRDALRTEKRERPFRIDAMVVLPDHLHAIWTLPEGDNDFPGRWRSVKSRFTRSVIKAGLNVGRSQTGEYRLWQRRYWEHTIRDAVDFQRHVDYIHYNPVKHGWVSRVADWPHSSFHRYVRLGVLDTNWADAPEEDNGISFGE